MSGENENPKCEDEKCGKTGDQQTPHAPSCCGSAMAEKMKSCCGPAREREQGGPDAAQCCDSRLGRMMKKLCRRVCS